MKLNTAVDDSERYSRARIYILRSDQKDKVMFFPILACLVPPPLFLSCRIFPRFCSPAHTGVRDEQVPPKLRPLENLHG